MSIRLDEGLRMIFSVFSLIKKKMLGLFLAILVVSPRFQSLYSVIGWLTKCGLSLSRKNTFWTQNFLMTVLGSFYLKPKGKIQ